MLFVFIFSISAIQQTFLIQKHLAFYFHSCFMVEIVIESDTVFSMLG